MATLIESLHRKPMMPTIVVQREQGETEPPMDEPLFKLSWKEKAYLNEYYPENQVPSDELETYRFFTNELKSFTDPVDVAIIGTGPTLDDVILAAPIAKTIYACDYLPRNLDLLQGWIDSNGASRNWNNYTAAIHESEHGQLPSQEEILEREEDARRKTEIRNVDLLLNEPMGKEFRGKFPLVIMPFCAESATANKRKWRRMMRNACSLVAEGGMMLVGALESCKSYNVGETKMPCANISAFDMYNQLTLDFGPSMVNTKSIPMPEHENLGYKGIILARAVKLNEVNKV